MEEDSFGKTAVNVLYVSKDGFWTKSMDIPRCVIMVRKMMFMSLFKVRSAPMSRDVPYVIILEIAISGNESNIIICVFLYQMDNFINDFIYWLNTFTGRANSKDILNTVRNRMKNDIQTCPKRIAVLEIRNILNTMGMVGLDAMSYYNNMRDLHCCCCIEDEKFRWVVMTVNDLYTKYPELIRQLPFVYIFGRLVPCVDDCQHLEIENNIRKDVREGYERVWAHVTGENIPLALQE
jgi:hypothetical protein